MLGHLFGLLLAAAVAVPPSLQPGHQAGQQQAGGQDAEDAREAVQLEGAAVGVGAAVAAEVAAAGARPPLLLHDVQVAFLLQLQDPEGEQVSQRSFICRESHDMLNILVTVWSLQSVTHLTVIQKQSAWINCQLVCFFRGK